MKLITRTLLILAAIIICRTGVSATAIERVQLRDKYINSLPTLTTPADSLSALYNIVDLSLYDTRADASATLLDFAVSHGYDDVTLDMVRNLANTYFKDPDAMSRLMEIAESVPESKNQKETVAFLQIFNEIRDSRADSDEARQRHIVDLIKQFNSKRVADPYDQLVQLFTLCINLSGETNGELLDQYFGILDKKMEQMDLQSNALRNMLLVQRGIIYTNNGQHDKAVEVDRELLRLIEQQEQEYKAAGRPYRNYATYRYTYLNRMLRNFPALTERETEAIYHELLGLAPMWPSISREISEENNPRLFVLLKQQRYAEAIPMLKKRLAENSRINVYERRSLLQHLIKAAKAVGDDATLNEAAEAYAEAMDEYVEIKTRESLHELQIVYDLNESNEQAANVKLREQQQVNHTQKLIIAGACVLTVVLLAAILAVMVMARRYRGITRRLAAGNSDLRHERDKLTDLRDELISARDKARSAENRKTEFINYISHEILTPLNAIVEYSQMIVDSADESRRDYLQRFADVVRDNSTVLRTFAIDLQEASLLENNMMTVHIKPTDVKSLCAKAANSVQHLLKEGMTLTFAKAGAPECFINTDPYRVGLVLLSLMTNMVKYSSAGNIVLDYSMAPARTQIEITLTATGMYVPDELRDGIFERFTRLTSDHEGFGMGFYICRMVATLLNGSLEIDSRYAGPGTRFTFVLPANA